jgi:hypothetical protein
MPESHFGEALRFTVPGRLVSNNSVARADKGIVHKGANARKYQDFAAECAKEAVLQVGWVIPKCARILITVFNYSADADNCAKLLCDSIRGIAIMDDSRRHVRGVAIEHELDSGGPRAEVIVRPCEPLIKSKISKKRRVTPKSGEDVAQGPEALPIRAIGDLKPGTLLSFAETAQLMAQLRSGQPQRKK